jgi:hypothetical protein
MTSRTTDTSPLIYARVAGAVFLILLVCGPFSIVYVPSQLIVPGDATATANNIMASESLFRAGIIGEAIIFLSEIVMVVVLYVLLKPASKTLSLIAAFARLTMAIIQGINMLSSVAVLLLLSGAGYLTAFEPVQLHALVLLFVNSHEFGVIIWQMVFGLHCLVLGYLIFKSGYFPRSLGIMMIIASIGYLTDSFGNLFSSHYKEMFGWIVTMTVYGEFPFFLWLLFKGVNIQQWHDRS